jgi:hypothetical protein
MPTRTRVAATVLAACAAALVAADAPRKAKPMRSEESKPVEAVPAAAMTADGSCTAADKKTCTEYSGAFAGSDPRAACEKAGGAWSDGACPSEGRVGTCTQREVGTDARVIVRSYAPTSADDAKQECTKAPRAAFMPR